MNTLDVRKIGRALMSDGDFNRLLMNALAWASEYMAGEAEFRPHVLAFYRRPAGSHSLTVLMTPGWTDPESKDLLMTGMGRAAAESEEPLAAVFLVTEAWMTQRAEAEGLPDVPPSEDPERVEVVIVSGSTLDMRQNQAIIHIKRQEGLMAAGEVLSAPFIDDGRDEFQNWLLMQFLGAYAAEVMRRGWGSLPKM